MTRNPARRTWAAVTTALSLALGFVAPAASRGGQDATPRPNPTIANGAAANPQNPADTYPETISPEARAVMVRERGLDPSAEGGFPPQFPVTLELAQQMRDGFAASLREASRPLIEGRIDRIEEIQIAGRAAHLIHPKTSRAGQPGDPDPAADTPLGVLYIHGGAWVIGEPVNPISLAVAAEMETPVYAIRYPLGPEHPFPAAQDHVLAVYRELLARFGAGRVVVFGDSAGAHLALVLTNLALRDGIPPPAALALLSPPVEFRSDGRFADGDSRRANLRRDIALEEAFFSLDWGGAVLGEVDPRDPWLASPMLAPYDERFPPVLITTGTRDLLLSDSVRLHRALKDAGVPEVDISVWEGMWHVFEYHAGENMPEAMRSIEEIAAFLLRHGAKGAAAPAPASREPAASRNGDHPAGRFETMTMQGGAGRAAHLHREVRVWLPPGYDEPGNRDRRYPVMYFLDGQYVFEYQPDFEVDVLLDEMIVGLLDLGLIEPFIIVAIPSMGDFRSDEYLTPGVQQVDDETAEHAAGDAFVRWLVSDVMPRVEARFRVSARREDTAIAGASFAGVTAFAAGGMYPDRFGRLLMLSPFIPVLPDADIERWTIAGTADGLRRRMYVDYGGLEWGPENPDDNQAWNDALQAFVRREQAAGHDIACFYVARHEHDGPAWRDRLPAGLVHLFTPDWTESAITPDAEADLRDEAGAANEARVTSTR